MVLTILSYIIKGIMSKTMTKHDKDCTIHQCVKDRSLYLGLCTCGLGYLKYKSKFKG